MFQVIQARTRHGMPANLTPEYEKAERRYREASTDEERLDALREMLSAIPKHKGTEKMQADIKRRISQMRKDQAKKGRGAKGYNPFHIPKSGAGQVVLIGTPNVGKSMLVAATTNASVKVADYPYTTALPAPGMCEYQDVKIELVDTPPVTAENIPGGLVSTIRSADVLCIVLDAAADPLEQAETVLGLLEERSLVLKTTPRNQLDPNDRHARPAIIAANKADIAPPENITTLRELYACGPEILAISAATGEGLDELIRRFWQLLAVVRVYTKLPGKGPDHEKPFTLRVGSTVEDLARAVHRELPEKMKFARIWGGDRFEGQQVHRTEVLRDKDIVEIHE